MKMLFAAIAIVLCAGVALSEAASVPTLPTTAPTMKKVKPGDPCYTNKDLVTVCNTGESTAGDITIDPQTGSTTSSTTVEFKNNATGSVTGIDSNDVVNTAAGSHATITGTGGTVNLGPGSFGTITNSAPAGGGSITVKTGGATISVPPGSTIGFGG